MTEPQFESFVESSNADYARESPLYRDLPFAEALEFVIKEFYTRTAPEGLNTPGHHFIAIMNGTEQVGYLHLSEKPVGTKILFAWDFAIHPEHQKKGYGKTAMLLAQKHFSDLGYTKVILNVFAENAGAIKLYEAFGFKVTQFNMERVI